MIRWFCSIMALALLVTYSVGSNEDDVKMLQGTWVVVSGEKGAKQGKGPDYDNFAAKFRLVIDGNKFQTSASGSDDTSGTFEVDSSKSPKEITLDASNGIQIKGIYQFEDGKLRLNAGKMGGPRPKAFKTEEGSSAILLVLKKKAK